MTASELAFLGLGLVFGVATGAALIALRGTGLLRREIRVTVTRDAVPRRSETLSHDAFVTSPAQPAAGGPADRRSSDRSGSSGPSNASRPSPPASAARARGGWLDGRGSTVSDRTPVQSAAAAVGAAAVAAGVPTGVPAGIAAELDAGVAESAAAELDAVVAASVSAVVDAGVAASVAASVAAGVSAGVSAGVAASAIAGVAAGVDERPRTDWTSSAVGMPSRRVRPGDSRLERMLRGEHRAMVEAVDALAGEDAAGRREWELRLGRLVEALEEVAVTESVIDFPMGTAFWDTFTVEQCRQIVAALASMGFRYDGRSRWLDGRAPSYRDLAQALADIGVEPRRVRAWPNQSDIAGLFEGARPAPEELLAAAGPDYSADAVRELVGGGAGLDDLWAAWDGVRPVLLEDAGAT